MLVLIQILFWISVFAIAHTYVFYPLLVILLAKNKKENTIVFSNETLPEIAIIMAVHNEEQVIYSKLKSIVSGSYPQDKIMCYIGSDASTDNTDKIIKEFALKHRNIKFIRFNERSGKILIINKLSDIANANILVLTDANAILSVDALRQLIKHFKNEEINVVGGRLINSKQKNAEIALQEHAYIEGEFRIKISEGKLWGTMMGAYGALYAIRKRNFTKVPDNFLVDDFYISLKAIQSSGLAICEAKAIAYENVPGNLSEEFRRKVRISTGNFQNLKAFLPSLLNMRLPLLFGFISHKILRWLSPFFIIFSIISLIFLINIAKIYVVFAIFLFLNLIILIIDYFFRKNQIQILPLRFITHFYYMNIALFIGFLKYMKGVKTNVWRPTKR